MSRRWAWIGVLAVADAIVIVSTIHAHEGFRPGYGAAQTQVITLGQALGWLFGVGLFLILLIAIFVTLRSRRR